MTQRQCQNKKASNPKQPAISRILVVAPVNTLQNWVDEYRRWCAPPTRRSNNVVLLTAGAAGTGKSTSSSVMRSALGERASVLQAWYLEGGICVIGYDLFRRLVVGSTASAKAPTPALGAGARR